MKEESVTDTSLRQYLLGTVADDEQELIENLFLTDSQTKERILTVEQDLIEDYLEDNLTSTDEKRFVSRYAQTAEQRRQLRITRSIKSWATKSAEIKLAALANNTSDSGLSRTGPRRVPFPTWLRPVVVIPVVVSAIIVIVVAAFLLNNRRESEKRAAIELELAQLNSAASISQTPEQVISVELRPVSIRSEDQQSEVKLRAGINLVELQLPWLQKERYQTYEAEVHRLRDGSSFHIHPVQGNGGEPLHIIRVRLPTSILSAGQYQLELRGISADGTKGPAEEYAFVVSN
jgi:hypothetical protein